MDTDHPFEILQAYSLVTAPLEGLALGWSEPVRICYSARHTALDSEQESDELALWRFPSSGP